MTMVKEYDSYADECRVLAQCPGNDSAQLLKIAAMWDVLANEQAPRFSQSYEPSWLRRAATRLFLSRAVRD